jgi:SAM-dependent methyltransferase
MPAMPDDHDAVTIDQFTRQAGPFAAMPAHADADILDLIRAAARLTPALRVLDVACGPGLVSLALAPHASHVTGLDLTPAMLGKARDLQRHRGLANLAWDLGRADSLPYPAEAFDAVVTRWSFHHLLDPGAALAEMVRVCRPGGRVVVADVYAAGAEQAAEYDRLERLRDPSHVHVLVLDDFRRLVRTGGLVDLAEAFSRLPLAVDDLLAASFPVAGGAEEFRRAGTADVGSDRTGLGFHDRGGRLFVSFPSVVFGGTRPG